MNIMTAKRKKCVPHKFPLQLNLSVSVPVLMMAGVLVCGGAHAQNVVIPRTPVPTGQHANTSTSGASPLPTGPAGNGPNLGNATTPIYAPTSPQNGGTFGPFVVTLGSKPSETINQTSSSGILNWAGFDIGPNSTVTINQPSASSVLLNRIDTGLTTTMINGALNANGIVYFYNPNGIIFGRNATVSVNSLVATSLNISNTNFLDGLFSSGISPIFQADPNFSGVPGSVIVEGDSTGQAQLNAATNGKIMLFAPNVVNSGIVTAPDGQVIMAAGGKVYLQAPTDATMRGLYVEVDSSNLPAVGGKQPTTSVVNAGAIAVGRGNASLVGLAVSQNGSINAQTSINLNGSIYLKASGNASAPPSIGDPATPTAGGTLTIGPGSITQVSIYDDGGTRTQGPSDSKFTPSQITMTGQNIVVQSGAAITAPGGNVSITAQANPTVPAITAGNASSIDLQAGSVIDVSGYDKQTMAMSSNVISVQLLAELADNLVLRDSSIRGQTLNFDIRNGTNIADISADLAKIPYSVGQLAATGGSVTLSSEGSIVTELGSKINVSGGVITYLPGYLNTSFLSSGGALYSDSTAPTDKTYVGVVNLPDGRWDYEPGYIEGKSAGTVAFNAPSIVMQGTLIGTATNGLYQRNVSDSNRAQGGQLIVNTVLDQNTDGNTLSASLATYNDQVVLNNNATAPQAASVATALASNRLDINVDALKLAGFTGLSVINSGEIDVAGSISLGSGGTINLSAFDNANNQFGNINFNGGVSISGGTLKATAANTLTVANGVQFDLGGLWTNDSNVAHPGRDVNGNPIGDIVTTGGGIALNANQIVIEDNVTMDVSGGVWLNNKKKLSSGNGGTIALDASNETTSEQNNNDIPLVEIGKDLTLDSFSMAKGGTLSITTNNIYVGGFYAPTPDVTKSLGLNHAASSSAQNPAEEYLWLPVGFFQQGGFTNFDLTAYSTFYINPGSQISPLASNWIFKNYDSYRTVASGSMSSVAAPGFLNLAGPQSGRSPVNLSFTAQLTQNSNVTGNLIVGDNAKITTDPSATISLLAGQLLNMDGTIDAPSGTINLGLSTTPSNYVYNDQRSIWLGTDAHLFAQGTTSMLYTNGLGITSGNVLDGGQVNLGGIFGDTGYLVVSQQDAFSQLVGATIDVSGTVSAPIAQGNGRALSAPQVVASAGGSINIEMREGILFGGTMSGKAGNSTQQGGSLSMTLDQGASQSAQGFPDADPSTFNIVGGSVSGNVPSGVQPGGHIGNGTNALADQAWISTDSFANGGFDRLYFKSQDAIVLSSATGTLNLNAKSSLYLDAPTLRVAATAGSSTPLTDVEINSAYVQLGSDDLNFQNSPTTNDAVDNANYSALSTFSKDVSTGAAQGVNVAKLDVNATTIDLAGTTVVQGVNQTNLNAAQDIRLVGITEATGNTPTLAQILPTGEFSVTGQLNLTASQVYPITLSTFALNVEGAGSTLNFGRPQSGYVSQSPWSAAGTLYGYAQTINQNGTVLAPFGVIDLQASQALNYGAKSITSVAGVGTVPFGEVQNGTAWVYNFGNATIQFALDPTTTGNYPEMTLPSKAIISQAPTIITNSSAVLNLSGGGSLYAYEFTPGSYGTYDVLGNTNASGAPSNVYAINPNYTAAVAPRDYQYGYGSTLQPGQSVYLSGIAGLPAGNYLLLPAHYALLPGGMAITLTPNSNNVASVDNVVNLDGSFNVSGRANVLGAGQSVNSGYVVTPGSVIREESQYQEYSATSFFTSAAAAAGVAVPQLPNDGGYLEFDATNILTLAGQFLLNPDKNGRRGSADISAADIEVVADGSTSQSGNGVVVLTAGELNDINADSLMLGGQRQVTPTGTNVSVGAQNVTLNNGSDALTGPEIIVVAQDNLTVASGAVIKASGTLSQTPSDLNILATDPYGNHVGTDGALLLVSTGAPVTVTRQAPAQLTGTLTIGQGATVSASGIAILDATLNSQNNGQLNLTQGATLDISSSTISLGNGIPTAAKGVQFNNAQIASLSTLSSLELSSYSTINLYGAVTLGDLTGMKSLTLNASGLVNESGTNTTSTFQAQTVSFGGGTNSVSVPETTAGTVNVTAQNIELGTGSGSFSVQGFNNVGLVATNAITAAGSGTFSAQNNLALTANVINANSLSATTIQAGNGLPAAQLTNALSGHPTNGVLSLNSSGTLNSSLSSQLGGSLNFEGDSIDSTANVTAQEGQIAFNATGDVHITGGTINASGASEVFGSTIAYAPAGNITLSSTSGNVRVDSGSTLNVSATGAAAGTITVLANSTVPGANGTVSLAGNWLGKSTAGVAGAPAPSQGSFVLDVGQLTSTGQFDQINDLLANNGFTESVNVRVRNGDITLGHNGNTAETLIAQNVTISADNGNVNINGEINAQGAQGGNISVYAQQSTSGNGNGNVNLNAGSQLLANATTAATSTAGTTGVGGSIVIGTSILDGSMQATVDGGADINFANGATINVGGLGQGANGNVLFRAPRVGTGGGSDVAITYFDGKILSNPNAPVNPGLPNVASIEAYKVYVASSISEAATTSNGDGTYNNIKVDNTTGVNKNTGIGTLLYVDASNFVGTNDANVFAIDSRLSLNNSIVPIEAGIEIRSPANSDLTVSVNEQSGSSKTRGWDLSGWRFNGQPIGLTLRASGNLNIDGSISDGFTAPNTGNVSMPDWNLASSPSSSYRLVGGADFSAADPLAVIANNQSGNVNINFARSGANANANDAPVAMVRTGTGTISVAAGGNVYLDQTTDPANSGQILGATIYTAGMQDPDTTQGTIVAPKNQLNQEYGATNNNLTAAQFGDDGGAISILAMGNVIGAPASQLVNNWLFHQGETTTDANGNTVFSVIKGKTANTAWWSRPDYFDQGIATLAGGDVSVVAVNGNLQDISASVATDAYMPGVAPTNLVERGGGNLNVSAGGNILGGSFYVQNGVGSIFAGGSITGGNQSTLVNGAPNLNTLLALGNAQINVTARNDLTIETAYNPTMTDQNTENSGVKNVGGLTLSTLDNLPQYSNFSTYSDTSAVNLTAVDGNVLLTHNIVGLASVNNNVLDFTVNSGDYNMLYNYQPPNLNAIALNGNVSSTATFTLAGAPYGQMNLLAGNSISLSGGPILMSDVPIANLSPFYAPRELNLADAADGGVLSPLLDASPFLTHIDGGLHDGALTNGTVDSQPVRIIALNGDIVGADTLLNSVILPKQTEIFAGHNIQDFGFIIQNNSASDITTETAGNDIVDTTVVSTSVLNQVQHFIDGPGALDISAGHTFDLGDSNGVISRGNLDNPAYLPAVGASINIQAGSGSANYAAFADKYVTASSLSTTDQTALLNFMQAINPAAATSVSAAWKAFTALPAAQQNVFLNGIKPDLNALFFSQLVTSSTVKGLSLFDATIASLYSNINPNGGDINIFGSTIQTNQGGSIYMFAPSGSVYAGLNNVPSYLYSIKTPAQLGVFTDAGGAIGALVNNNFEVYQGRVFTLAGGDITLVSQYGDLSAGEGTKTASSAPPPTLTTSTQGVTTLDISGSISGSGIATLKTNPDVPDANIYVIAPRGVFDAGDAGVRSSGSVDINAVLVLNAGNIVAAGAITGVPSVENANIAAGVPTNATPSSSDLTKNIANAASTANNDTTSLSVDVLGYGSDCKEGKDGCSDDKAKSAKKVTTDSTR